MGCDYIWDYRYRDNNLIFNAADPNLNLGANTIITNGGFEGTYVGGVAPNWTFAGTGTPSEETNLPWDSDGVSAQKLTNDTDYGAIIFYQSLTANLTLEQTYQLKFKVQVTSGFARIGIAGATPFNNGLMVDFDASDGIVEGTLYFSVRQGSVVQIKMYNTGTSTPLTCIFDDFEIRAVQNDKHIFLYPVGYDEGQWEEDGYDFAGITTDCGINYNRTGQLNAGSEITSFSLLTPNATSNTTQAFWDEIGDNRSMLARTYGGPTSQPDTNVSADGLGYARYKGSGVDPRTLGRLCWINEYDGPGGTETMTINDVDYPTAYTLGVHKTSLYQNASYFHGSRFNYLGNFTGMISGKGEVFGYFDRILDAGEKLLLSNLLRNMR